MDALHGYRYSLFHIDKGKREGRSLYSYKAIAGYKKKHYPKDNGGFRLMSSVIFIPVHKDGVNAKCDGSFSEQQQEPGQKVEGC